MASDADKPSPKAQRCHRCQEWIRNPTPYGTVTDPFFVCDECSGARAMRQQTNYHSRENGEAADRQYHGGQGGRGEW